MKKKNLFFRLILAVFIVLIVIVVSEIPQNRDIYERPEITSGAEANQLLAAGNARFVTGKLLNDDFSSAKREDLAKNGQHPFATILTCSDSRVSPELIFDQGLGDIFIVRNAGEVLDPIAEGSIEYGLEHLKTPLLVVLGHSKCGAVKSAVETIEANGKVEGNMGEIIKKIAPAVKQAKDEGATGNELYTEAEDENIELVMAGLLNNPIVKELVVQEMVTVVGAKYHVDSGTITWVKPVASDE